MIHFKYNIIKYEHIKKQPRFAETPNFIEVTANLVIKFKKDIYTLLSESEPALIFWISFFKNQMCCTADEFLQAFKSVCCANKME